jgi:hypothetical protein
MGHLKLVVKDLREEKATAQEKFQQELKEVEEIADEKEQRV